MKKGFTLTELLAVLVILGLVAAISYPVVNKSVEKYREKLLTNQENNIILAAKLWGNDNEELLPTNSANTTLITYDELKVGTDIDYGVIKITYGNLITEKYIDRAKNPVTKVDIADDDYYVLIKKSTKKWSYELQKNS